MIGEDCISHMLRYLTSVLPGCLSELLVELVFRFDQKLLMLYLLLLLQQCGAHWYILGLRIRRNHCFATIHTLGHLLLLRSLLIVLQLHILDALLLQSLKLLLIVLSSVLLRIHVGSGNLLLAHGHLFRTRILPLHLLYLLHLLHLLCSPLILLVLHVHHLLRREVLVVHLWSRHVYHAIVGSSAHVLGWTARWHARSRSHQPVDIHGHGVGHEGSGTR